MILHGVHHIIDVGYIVDKRFGIDSGAISNGRFDRLHNITESLMYKVNGFDRLFVIDER